MPLGTEAGLGPGDIVLDGKPGFPPQENGTASLPFSAQYLWLPGLFSCRLYSLELSPGFYPGPDHQCRLFQTSA